jgi:hypothetical protein
MSCTGWPLRPPAALTDFCQACRSVYPTATVVPNAPEQEHSTPIVMGVPAAAAAAADAVAAALVAPAAGDEPLVVLLDEHALIDTTAAKTAATSIKILRCRAI